MKPADGIQVSTLVRVDRATAFEVFTTEIEAWWKRDSRYRIGQPEGGALMLEPGTGGRFLERSSAGEEHVIGQITVWEPPDRVVLTWFGLTGPGDDATEVEVAFATEGDATRVTIEHRGWERIPKGHPQRLGFDEPAFTYAIGTYWADLLTSLRIRTR